MLPIRPLLPATRLLPLSRLGLTLITFALVACGGGSSDKGNSSSSSSLSSASSSVSSSASSSSLSSSSSANSSSAVSSSLTSSSSSSSSAISSSEASSSSTPAELVTVKINGTINGFDEAGDNIPFDDQVQVELVLLDEAEKTLATATPLASDYQNSSELRFSADLSGAGATSLALHISAPGFTSYARKLDAENQILIDAKLQAVPVQTVLPGTATTISGVELPGFNIQVSGDDEQQSNSLLINIPQSLLPDDTSSLEVAVRTFDPNEPEDAEFFPGAYADSDGNQLASVGFNFAEIKTNSNDTLATAMRKARQQKQAKLGAAYKAQAEEPVLINYQIPSQSCALLESQGDSAPELAGFQVPVYTYNPNSGLWDLIGQGTLYRQDGQQVPANQTLFDCDSDSFTLEILVTNEIFLREWWNLDYPIGFSQPQEYCARVEVKNPEGQPLSGLSGLVMDNDGDFDFASLFFTSDNNGQASIRIAQSGLAPDLEAEVIFFAEEDFSYVTHKIALSSDCSNPPLQPIELSRPQLCAVEGQFLFENGAPVTRNLVYGISDETSQVFGYDFTNSDSNGKYRLQLPCTGSYDILNYAAILSGNEVRLQHSRIDGNLDADEASDDGALVVMQTQTILHSQPLVYGYYDPDSQQLVLLTYGNYDAFPMTAQIRLYQDDEQVLSFSTEIAADQQPDDEGEMAFYFQGTHTRSVELPASNTPYLLEASYVDALGKTWSEVTGVIWIGNPQDDEDESGEL